MFRSIPIISVIGAFILFLAILGGYYFWLPKYSSFQNLKLILEAKKEQIAYAEEHLSNLQNLSRRLDEHQDEIDKIDSALPFEFSISALFNFIQKNSSKNGLILEDIQLDESSLSGLGKAAPVKNTPTTIQTEQQEDGLSERKNQIEGIPFTISVFGTYSGFKDFILAIHNNSRIIEVDFIDFSSGGEDGEEIETAQTTGLFVFNLKLRTHHYKRQ